MTRTIRERPRLAAITALGLACLVVLGLGIGLLAGGGDDSSSDRAAAAERAALHQAQEQRAGGGRARESEPARRPRNARSASSRPARHAARPGRQLAGSGAAGRAEQPGSCAARWPARVPRRISPQSGS